MLGDPNTDAKDSNMLIFEQLIAQSFELFRRGETDSRNFYTSNGYLRKDLLVDNLS